MSNTKVCSSHAKETVVCLRELLFVLNRSKTRTKILMVRTVDNQEKFQVSCSLFFQRTEKV